MDEILELAERLGKRIAADPRGGQMAKAQAALNNSTEDRQLISDYEAQQRRIGQLELQGKPIEPEDKHRLADLHAKVIASEVIKGLMKAQADFAELMSTVSRRIEQEVMGSPGEQ